MAAPKQQDVTIEELNQLIRAHMEERDWHTNPSRGLAISLSLEANELLEQYQWSSDPVGGTDAVGDELADIFIYGIQLAQQNDIDIVSHIRKKLEKSAKKYPAENFKGKNESERVETWFKNKLAHKKSGL
jgi:NTP pyrophosphatase (non-canonical NTP hydrolase)